MRRVTLVAAVVCLGFLGAQAAPQIGARAEAQDDTQSRPDVGRSRGPIWRINQFDVKSGKIDDFLEHLQKDLKPMYDAAKREGDVIEYKVYVNSFPSGPDDWDVAIGFRYKNFAALDGRTARVEARALGHHKTDVASEAAQEKHADIAEVVSVRLLQEINFP